MIQRSNIQSQRFLSKCRNQRLEISCFFFPSLFLFLIFFPLLQALSSQLGKASFAVELNAEKTVFLKKKLFFHFWLHWLFTAAGRLSLFVAHGRLLSKLQPVGSSSQWLLLLRTTGSGCPGFSSCGTMTLGHSSFALFHVEFS